MPNRKNDPHNNDTGLPVSSSEQVANERHRRKKIFLWEITQSAIAFLITCAVVYLKIIGIESTELRDAFFLVVAMYFMKKPGEERPGNHG